MRNFNRIYIFPLFLSYMIFILEFRSGRQKTKIFEIYINRERPYSDAGEIQK